MGEPDVAVAVIYGQQLGKAFWLEPGQHTIGRSEACAIVLEGEGISREHARLSVDGERIVVEDLGSTNGTSVDGASVDGPTPIAVGAKLEIGPVILRIVGKETLLGTAVRRTPPGTDGLTRLANTRVAEERLAETMADPMARPLSLLLFDIDGFEAINRRHGYLFGDELMVAISRAVEPWVREGDLLARLTGTAWLVLCRMAAGPAVELGEAIRNVVATMAIPRGVQERVTVSVGVASLGIDDGPDADAIGRAEAALREAKDTGRNRVCVHAGPKR